MILVSDMDKTVFFPDDPIRTKHNVEAIAKWKEAGNTFIVATGRSIRSLNSIVNTWGGLRPDYCFCDGGLIIFDQNEQVVYANTFNDEEERRVLSGLDGTGLNFVNVFYATDSEGLEYRKKLTKIRFWFKELADARRALGVLCDRGLRAFICEDPGTSFYEPLREYESFVEVIPFVGGKEVAIKKFIQLFKISEPLYVVGDSRNDESMLAEFNGYMIANSNLDQAGARFARTDSVADLIEMLMG